MKSTKFCLLIASAIMLSSCHMLYLPNKINTPVLTSENDFSANASLGSSNINLQAAFSPVNNIGIMLNYAGGKTSYETNTLNSSNYNFYEFGLGYYKPITKFLLLDIYGGMGKGKSSTFYADDYSDPNIDGNYTRYFIQPSITLSAGDFVDLNFCIRPVLVNMTKISTSISNYQTFYMEPALTLRYGWRYVKIINQVGVSFPLHEFYDYQYNPFLMTVGVSFQLKSEWLKKKAKNSYDN